MEPPHQPRLRQPVALGICVALVLLYGVMAFWAVSKKSSTFDEPLHSVGSWVHWHTGDFRINFEDPPLWQYWATFLNGRTALKFDRDNGHWQAMPGNVYEQWPFTLDMLYRTEGINGEWFVLRARLMMVLLGMVLCGVVAMWAWRLGGSIAAVIATMLTVFDPNLLGHGALVKNDVSMGLVMAAVFLACWRVGEKLTWLNGIALAVLVGIAVNVKFSSLLFGPMLIILMGLRIVLPIPWVVLGRTVTRWNQKLGAVLGLFAVVGLVTYLAVWATYGFRFDPSPDPNVRLNTYNHKIETTLNLYRVLLDPPPVRDRDESLPIDRLMADLTEQYNVFAQADKELREAMADAALEDESRRRMLERLTFNGQLTKEIQEVFSAAQHFRPANVPPPEHRAPDFDQQYKAAVGALESYRLILWNQEHHPNNGVRLFIFWARKGDQAPDRFIAMLNFAHDYRLFPSAFLHGVLFVHARSIIRSSFLLGEVSGTGWWYYFPVAMLFKTPVATLAMLVAGLGVMIWALVKKVWPWQGWIWPAACLGVPVLAYMYSVMSANLNIGLRHVLCVYPLLFIAAGVMLSRALAIWPWIARVHLYVLAGLLLIESLVVFPNYIAYFNFAVGGSRGGFKLLSDSNLDWGQDLPLLKAWQDRNPQAELLLQYFGVSENVTVEGRQMSNMKTLPTFYGIKFSELPTDPAEAKGKVVAISATDLQGTYKPEFAAYRSMTPTAVLGGTIYLFDLRK